MGVAISMLALSVPVLIVVTRALLSPAGSVDSPLLAIIFLGLAILPFGVATVAIGCSRARLAQLRSAVRMLGL